MAGAAGYCEFPWDMLNCSVSQALKPMLCKWVTSAGEGPKVACSRKRPASLAVMTLMGGTTEGKGFKGIAMLPVFAASEPPMPIPVNNPFFLLGGLPTGSDIVVSPVGQRSLLGCF